MPFITNILKLLLHTILHKGIPVFSSSLFFYSVHLEKNYVPYLTLLELSETLEDWETTWKLGSEAQGTL